MRAFSIETVFLAVLSSIGHAAALRGDTVDALIALSSACSYLHKSSSVQAVSTTTVTQDPTIIISVVHVTHTATAFASVTVTVTATQQSMTTEVGTSTGIASAAPSVHPHPHTTSVTQVPTPSCGRQIIKNGGFDTGDFTDWTHDAQFPNETSAKDSIDKPGSNGSGYRYTANVLADTGSEENPTISPYSGTHLQQELDACANTSYTFSMDYWIETVALDSYLNVFIDDNYIISVHAGDPANVGEWKTTTASFLTENNGTVLDIYATCTNYDSEVFHVDNIMVTLDAQM